MADFSYTPRKSNSPISRYAETPQQAREAREEARNYVCPGTKYALKKLDSLGWSDKSGVNVANARREQESRNFSLAPGGASMSKRFGNDSPLYQNALAKHYDKLDYERDAHIRGKNFLRDAEDKATKAIKDQLVKGIPFQDIKVKNISIDGKLTNLLGYAKTMAAKPNSDQVWSDRVAILETQSALKKMAERLGIAENPSSNISSRELGGVLRNIHRATQESNPAVALTKYRAQLESLQLKQDELIQDELIARSSYAPSETLIAKTQPTPEKIIAQTVTREVAAENSLANRATTAQVVAVVATSRQVTPILTTEPQQANLSEVRLSNRTITQSPTTLANVNLSAVTLPARPRNATYSPQPVVTRSTEKLKIEARNEYDKFIVAFNQNGSGFNSSSFNSRDIPADTMRYMQDTMNKLMMNFEKSGKEVPAAYLAFSKLINENGNSNTSNVA